MDKLKVVIADDEALIRLDISEMLTEAGYEVIGEASNGEEALDLVTKLKPDLAILDVQMPVMDGLKAASFINDKMLAPVLLLTAFSQVDIVEKAKKAGVLAYIVKPVREEQLFPAIQIAVSRFKEIKDFSEELGSVKEALDNRIILDRAKGILMDAYGLKEDEAYKKLRQYAMNKRLSLKEVAKIVIKAREK
jgi:response regulator NasT